MMASYFSDASSSNSARGSASGRWLDVIVEFAHSPADEDEQLPRSERYRRMHADAQRHRQQLEAWIEGEGLADEIKDIGETTAFDLLFVKVTPQAASALRRAPDVIAVTPAGEFSH